MNILDLFNLSFIGRHSKVGLQFQGQDFSFGDIDQRSNRMACVLAKRGMKAGDRLGIYLENSLTFVDVYLACLKLGIIAVPINILYKDREISHIHQDSSPNAIISKEPIEGIDTWIADEIQAIADSASDTYQPPILDGDSPAAIIYTSGTTGASKGAVLTHNNFLANTVNLNSCWSISEADRLLLGLPLFHVHGLANGMHCAFAAGSTTRLLPRFEHQKIKIEFEDFRPTLFYGVPTVYVRLLEHSDPVAADMSKSMRLFVSGSAPLPPQVLEDFKNKYGHTILERYGMTETLMNISNPYSGERRAGTVGFPLPGLSAKIIKPNGEKAGIDEEGELHVKGPNVFKEYWNRPDATANAFDQYGYFKTGDMAVVSSDGYYTLRGRKSDLIISGGFNIYPREIEEFLLEQNDIAEAAVVGIPDNVRGELPVAYLVGKGNVDLESLEAKCKKALASFKVPRKFVLVDALPRTALGKVQKHLLPR